jgi:ABC-2 type transport system ATP-binding protein
MISVSGLTLAYPGGPRAVDGIDLTVEAREIYGFIGPNGAGESTTILMSTTLPATSSGVASVARFELLEAWARRGLDSVERAAA